MRQYEFSAKNVQDAISKGLSELKVNQEDVDIKILAEGGFFTKAKILIITEEEEIKAPEPVTPIKRVVKAGAKKVVKKAEKSTKVKEDKKAEKVPVTKVEKLLEVNLEPKPEPKPKVKKEYKKVVLTNGEFNKRPSVVFIKTLAEKLNVNPQIVLSEEDENLLVELNGENAGHLIGYRGEGLVAIQYISNIVEINSEGKEGRRRIVLNIENYKEKREESLTNLAKRIAEKAIRTNHSQRLEAMNAYDRRIIHAALTDSGVTTYSKGEEPRRFLVIEPKK